jgi:phytanoyl-CoA hydroxylase
MRRNRIFGMAVRIQEIDAARFERDGYVVARQLVDETQRAALERTARQSLDPLSGPVEFEADLGYPGAPHDRSAAGGETPRCLLSAYSRAAAFRAWQTDARLGTRLRSLLGGKQPMLSQSHHNCIMTKYPGYSSATRWHQDIRYWSFDRAELISVWLALGAEVEANGALSVIPGSHRLELDRGRFDADLFLRRDMDENRSLLDQALVVELEPGDVLFFHCRLFHAAGTNRTAQVKLSLVSTYHAEDNHPIPETRSAQYPPVPVDDR